MRKINQHTLIWNDDTKQIIFADYIENADIATGEQIRTFDTAEQMQQFINNNELKPV